MQESTTVQQLSQALNELLDAYDKLKFENKQIIDKNEELEQHISELEGKNSDLESQLNSLTDTSNQNSNEIDTMLGRIKSILVEAPEQKEEQTVQEKLEEEVEDVINNEIYKEESLLDTVQEEAVIEQPEPVQQQEQTNTYEDESSSEIDLGRMQSLLNGFNK